MENNLYVKSIIYNKDKVKNENQYPFNIPAIKDFERLDLDKNVTFFVGENGTGKSTLIEAIAINLKLNPEGGTQNFNFNTQNTHSNLYDYIKLTSSGLLPKTKFFLRAESFYNFASEIQRLVEEDEFYGLYNSYGGNLHQCSHGESFLKLVQNRFTGNGLYILDEPEAALSPNRQMSLLCLIDQLVKDGAQFIICTHSPILLSYRNANIYDLNNSFEKVKYEDTEIYRTYKMFLDNPNGMLHQLLD